MKKPYYTDSGQEMEESDFLPHIMETYKQYLNQWTCPIKAEDTLFDAFEEYVEQEQIVAIVNQINRNIC